MKISTISATFLLALMTNVHAAPAIVGSSSLLTKRETDDISALILRLNEHSVKRSMITDPVELQTREYTIVTQILAAVKDTNLAPSIIQGLVNNADLQPIVTKAVEVVIKSGVVSLKTLLTALNDSGLANKVIHDLINDCTLYKDIFKLAMQEIENLGQQINKKISGSGDADSVKRFDHQSVIVIGTDPDTDTIIDKRFDTTGIVDNLLESLANSGLASSVVRALMVDPQFLQYGASLIVNLLQDKLIDFGSLLSSIVDSGLVTSLFKEFLNISTLKTVVLNALGAAFNDCDGSNISGAPTGLTTQATSTTLLPTFTATATATATTKPKGNAPVCRKKKEAKND